MTTEDFGAKIQSEDSTSFIVAYRIYNKNKKRVKSKYEPEAYKKAKGMQEIIGNESTNDIQEFFTEKRGNQEGFTILCAR